jgi:hypothetical protein
VDLAGPALKIWKSEDGWCPQLDNYCLLSIRRYRRKGD